MKLRIRLILAFVASLVSATLVMVPSSTAQTTTATVRIVHASPDAPPVDVYVDGSKLIGGLAFFTAGGYLTIPSGNRLIQVTPAGADLSSAVISATLPFAPGSVTTIAAAGLLGPPVPPIGQQFGPQLYTEDLSAPAAGKARLRVYHLSPDAPAVGVRLAGGATLIPSVSFPSASDALTVDAGTYNLEVFVVSSPTTVVQALNNVVLEAGKLYDVFATGQLASIAFHTQATSPNARVRIVHASPDAPAVDVYVNGSAVLRNIPFFRVTDYLDVPADTALQLQVTPAGAALSPATAVISTTASFGAGQAYSVAAIGRLTAGVPVAQQFRATVVNEDLSPPRESARVRVAHFSPDAPNVDILIDGQATPIVSNLAYGNVSPFISVPAGSYPLVARVTGTTVTIPLGTFTVAAGKIYDFFATNLVANLTPQLKVTDVNLRAIHAAPDAPAVDVYLGATEVLSSVSFFTASPYLSIGGGENRFRVTAENAPLPTAVADTLVTTEMGRAYSLAAIGRLTGTPPAEQAFRSALYVDDISQTVGCNTRVRVYHFSPDAPAVDVRAVGVANPLISNLSYGNASANLNITGGVYSLQVTPAGATTPVVIDLPNTQLTAGKVYSVFATDLLANITPQVSITETGGGQSCSAALPLVVNP